MTAIEFMKVCLEGSRQWLLALIADMKDAPLTRSAPGGNHPLWILGHVVGSEMHLLHRFILGEESPKPEWEPLFGQASKPLADEKAYPSIDVLLGEYEKVRAATLKTLERFTDADLDKPSKAPQELKHVFGTIGQCFMMVALHTTFHAGQVADARRVLGRKPVFG